MNITITPQNLSFNKNVQYKKNTNFQKESPSCSPSFGDAKYKRISYVFRIFQNPFTKKPKMKLKPTANSIIQYINSIYNKDSGFGVEGFDELVNRIKKNINNRSVIFAKKLVKLLPKSSNNLGLNNQLRQSLELLERFNKNPNERKALIKSVREQTKLAKKA